MNDLNGKLQYQLSNGSWMDCEERTEEFLNLCVEHDYRHYSMDQVIEMLNSGKRVRNDKEDWYSECRIELVKTVAPVLQEWEPDSEEWGY